MTDRTGTWLIETGLAFFRARALHAAVELGVFETLAEEPRDRATLAEWTGVDPGLAADFFDSLVAVGVLEREDGAYRNSETASDYLVSASDTNVAPFFDVANHRMYPAWEHLSDVLRTGKARTPGNRGADESAFETLFEDDERLATFVAGMSGLSAISSVAIAERFPWDEYDSMCDLGTSQGKLPVEVARRHDHLDLAGLDLPPVEPHFREFVADHDLEDRVRFHAADFFADPLPDADVFVLGHLLHNWRREKKCDLLQTVYDALPAGGAAVVYGTMIDDTRRENELALLMSLNMRVVMDDGGGYTFTECEAMLRDVGFADTRRADLPGPDSMVVAEK